MKASVLVVDDDPTSLANLAAVLSESGYQVTTAGGGRAAIERAMACDLDVVVSDIRMEDADGLELLDALHERCPETAVILVTGYGTIESAVEAMRKGAFDYLSKPVDINKLELLIEKAVQTQKLVSENVRLRRQLNEKYSFGNIVGRSAPLRQIFSEIEQVAQTNATVLIQGESGTGKELIASALHHHSRRSDAPLIKVNCVALVEGLIESELFGHEKGAFTGAHRTRKGRIEMANGGSLFLDEIGDLSQATQLKLLRVLQEREIERVGGNRTIPVDVRLIAATNKDLEAEVARGAFREELYYRLKVISIRLPALRERSEDIPILVDHFTQLFNQEHDKQVEGFSPAAMRQMVRYAWPGNVRELRNMVESLVVMARSSQIDERDLPCDLSRECGQDSDLLVPVGTPLSEAERQLILATLRQVGNNKARAARILGIGKKTLYRKLKEYGLFDNDPADLQPLESAPDS
jgi:DNA-binding NtrC family response regulator